MMKCVNCGKEFEGKFCPECGSPATPVQSPAQQPMPNQQVPMYQQVPVQKPVKKIKWWMILIGVVVLIVLMKACFGGGSSEGKQSVSGSDQGKESVVSVEKEDTHTVQDKGTLGDYEVEILSAKVAKDYDGKPALIVNFKFTNNSDEATSFLVALSDKAYQDGIQLESAIILNSKTYDADESMKDIKPGKSITVQQAYVLNDKTTPVEIEVSETFSFSKDKVVKTFTLE